jgi:hypothetical protein
VAREKIWNRGKFACGIEIWIIEEPENCMTHKDNELLKARVRQWNVATPVMQGIRDCDIQSADTARALAFFRGAVLAALPKNPPLPWSGLVEQQQWFSKLRKS